MLEISLEDRSQTRMWQQKEDERSETLNLFDVAVEMGNSNCDNSCSSGSNIGKQVY